MGTTALALAASLATPALAQERVWNGSADSDWTNGTNWNGGLAPVAGDDVLIDTDSPRSPTLTTLTPNLRTVTLAGASSATLNVDSANGLLSANGMVIGRDSGSDGNLFATNSGRIQVDAGNLVVGARGNGTATVSSGSSLIVNTSALIVGQESGSVGVVNLTDGSVNAFNTIVGQRGFGTMNLSSAGRLTGRSATVGEAATGFVIVDGASSYVDLSDTLTVGNLNGGFGFAGFTNSARLISANVQLGVGAGSTGNLRITSGSTWANSNRVSIGINGTSTVEILNGASLNTFDLEIASGEGSTGTLNLSAATIGVTNFSIGNGGNATLSVDDSGPAAVNTAVGGITLLGTTATGKATVDLIGANTRWMMGTGAGALVAGNTDFHLSRQAQVSVGGVVLGSQAFSNSFLTVAGMGTLWAAGQSVVIGDQGNGTVGLLNGGQMTLTTNGIVTLGAQPSGQGDLILRGLGAALTGTNLTLLVGDLGRGSLLVDQGAAANFIGTTIAGLTGGVGDVTVRGAGSTLNGTVSVGQLGQGTFTLDQGALLTSDAFNIAAGPGSSGAATFDGANTVASIVSLGVGVNGRGALSVTGGATLRTSVETDIGIFGDASSASGGAVTVSGAGSNWDSTGSNIFVGLNASASLSVLNGGRVTAGNIAFGQNATANGTGLFSGPGTLVTASRIYVGASGAGTLTIDSGAAAMLGDLAIGYDSGSTGDMTVTGAGSSVALTGVVAIGGNGRGSLSILNGASVASNGLAGIGVIPGSSGLLVIDGAGSTFFAAEFFIGVGGSGTAILSHDGALSTVSDIVLGDVGAPGRLVIGAEAGQAAVASGSVQAASISFGADAALVFNHTDTDYLLNVPLISRSGTNGTIDQLAGFTRLTADSPDFAGRANVTGGTLMVDRQLGNGGLTSVSVTAAGRLGGAGSISGVVSVDNGGTLVGAQGQTLSIFDLRLGAGAHIDATFDAPGGSRLFFANNLQLDGAIDIIGGPAFGPGIYRLFDYNGVFTDNGLDIGTTPEGTTNGDFAIQTSIANQVNLVSTAAVQLRFWDGDAAGNANNNVVNGGNGIWTATSTNFTGFAGAANGAQSPQPSFVVFSSVSGNVGVSNVAGPISITGAQFAIDGYRVDGDPIALSGTSAILRVGDGSAASQFWIARIGSALTGVSGINKTDNGALILSGVNSYTGLTTISGGILSLSGAGSIATSSGVVNNGIFDISSTAGGASITTLSGSGAVGLGIVDPRTLTLTQASGTFVGTLNGVGNFAVAAGDETLTGISSMTGTVSIAQGAGIHIQGLGSVASASQVQVDGVFDIAAANAAVSINRLSGIGNVTLGSNAITLNGNSDYDGIITGTGSVTIAGQIFFAGNSTYTGGTRIAAAGLLGLGANVGGASSGSIIGDVVDDGRFVFVRNDDYTFAGVISGTGDVVQEGIGALRLAGANTYSGVTFVDNGPLIGALANFGQGDFFVDTAGTLVFEQPTNATLGRLINGPGNVLKTGAGTLTLTGNNMLAGTTTVSGGQLVVAGTLPGTVIVGNGGALAGGGSVGVLNVADGGVLNGTQGITLTSTSLNLGAGAVINAAFTSIGGAALFGTGDLVLDGTVNVTFGAGPGVYRLIDYSGTLTDNGLVVGNSGTFAGFVQTSVAGQVNLVGAANLTFWDGGAAANANNGQVDGGAGTWTVASPNFTDVSGQFNGRQTPQPSFVVFQAAPGIIAVDDSAGQVAVTGMQFASDGYSVTGGPLLLSAASSVIRVGDGSAAGGTYRATIGSALNGTAELQKMDIGTLILTGANTYSGGTQISAGTLQLGSGGTTGSILGDVLDNGAFAINRSDAFTFAGIISGTGGFMQAGSGTTTLAGANSYAGGTTIAAGTLVGTAASFGSGAIIDNAALMFAQTTDANYAGAISGTGTLAKLGAGTLTLSGTSGLTGGTTVSAGRLVVNGSLANSTVTVASGATLGGTGTVGGISAQVGGIVAPGNSIGVLNVAGNFAQAAGSTYRVELNSAGAADRILATGTATLAGGAVLNVVKTDAAPYLLGTRYTVLTAAGGVTGTYTLTGDVQPLTNFIGLKATYDATSVYLDVARIRTFAESGMTFNQTETGTGLDSLPGGALVSRMLALPDDASARGALDQLSGEVHASVRTAVIEDSRLLRGVVVERALHTDRGSDTQLWGQGIRSWARNDGDGNAATIDRSTAGLVVGLDASPTPYVRVGMLGAYTRADLSIPARRSTGSVDSYSLGLYAQGAMGSLRAKLGGTYSWQTIRTHRAVDFAGFSDGLRADYHGSTTQAFADLSYRVGNDWTFVEPFAQAALISLATSRFEEHGGAAALSGAERESSITSVMVGARGNMSFMAGSRYVSLRGSAGWRTIAGDRVPTASLAFGGGSAFAIAGAPIARNALVLEGGADLALTSRLSLNLNYSGQIAGHSHDNAIRGGISFSF